ncbi:hypothetical protein AB0E01_16720 [Nocardia vinacea]|uniref:hypothetical protein n=1 Tax=Nocardia vinacea TaxID=96468 RepID=UPI0033FF4DD7
MPMGIMARRVTATGRAIMTGVPRGELDDALIAPAADKVFAVLGELRCGAMKLGQALSVAEGPTGLPELAMRGRVFGGIVGSARSSMRRAVRRVGRRMAARLRAR